MKAKKKSRFLTFCFSVVPGAGEMYMGLMKMGVSLMTMFFLPFLIQSYLGLDSILLAALIIWFYGFFHANHLAGLSDEEFSQVKDKYLFSPEAVQEEAACTEKYKKWIGIVLILAGALILWNGVLDIGYNYLPEFLHEAVSAIRNYVPRILTAFAIIFIGIKMLMGRKRQLAAMEDMAGSGRAGNMDMAGPPLREE